MKLSTFGQKAGAIALAATMGIGSVAGALQALPAYAANGTVTINQNANENAAYISFRFFDADIDDNDKATNITWNDELFGDGTIPGDDENPKSEFVAFLNDTEESKATQSYDEFLKSTFNLKDADLNKELREQPQNVLEYISSQISAGNTAANNDYKAGLPFAEALAIYAQDNLIYEDEAIPAGEAYTNKEGYYLFVTDGNSLFEDKDTNDVTTAPIWLALGGKTTTVTEKAEKPTLNKKIKTGDTAADRALGTVARVGDDVKYVIDASLPSTYAYYDEYSFKITDTPHAGMVIAPNTADTTNIHVTTGAAYGEEGAVDVTSKFTIAVNADTGVLTVENTNLKDAQSGIPTLKYSDKIYVTYDATITDLNKLSIGGTSNAATNGADELPGNDNTAEYEYSNDYYDEGTGKTTSQTPVVFTFDLTVDKEDEKAGRTLSGVEFKIQNGAGDKWLKETWTEDGVRTASWTSSETDATIYVTGGTGKIVQAKTAGETKEVTNIAGVGAGTYTLVETKAATGYNLPSASDRRITINVEATTEDSAKTSTLKTGEGEGAYKVTVTSAIAELDTTESTTGHINIDIKNDKEVQLANTGGVGVGIAGAAVVTIGLGWYFLRNRKNAAEE